MGIPERLKECRAALGLSQAALAESLGVTKRSIINWEGGAASPSAEVLAKYAQLGVNAMYLLTGQGFPLLDDPRPVPPKYTPPPDEEWLLDAYRYSSAEVKAVIMGATKAAALAARGTMPASPRRKAS